jgi:Flp pilus assembly protein CpaB
MPNSVRIGILIALVIVVIGVVVAFVLPMLEEDSPPPQVDNGEEVDAPPVVSDAATPVPQPTQVLVDIVVAVQAISRGSIIPPNAVDLRPFPEEAVPQSAIGEVSEVAGRIARTDIFIEQPVLTSMIVDNLSDLAAVGSDGAALLPPGRVLIAVPMDRLTSVAYAIQPGDRVDVAISMLYVDIDEQFQSLMPNTVNLVIPSVDSEGNLTLALGSPISGRIETIPLTFPPRYAEFSGNYPVSVNPSEESRPRLVVQRTIQDAQVIQVGDFPPDGRLFGDIATPTPAVPVDEQPPAQQQQQQQQPPAEPTQPPPRPDIVALAVTPQEATVLTWLIEARVPITFYLRSAADTSLIPTDPVTLEYIMSQYNISVPSRVGFSIQPPIRSIRQLIAGDEIRLDN